ncbi:hypothetical protein PP914_gp175 [Arthrobacter phage Qui]|uniref:Uncharacterized protein n=1 Tax=Arthrobacter phage Qui TaxID=2603260 RepID=A0A5B8WGN2_9CAUD|nr:hypothetical protein PP914_gp175 [Arthrobacter phage Qui]QED11663.1 hypothetical protein SEA_QUI_175 [Arthrobacter phage Qui]QOC56494.1 hypothetical protein SEA_PAELLA_175 [Arthrobacter phage Paella]
MNKNIEKVLELMNDPGYKRRPYVKFIQKQEPILEAIYFDGTKKSADQIIEWVFMHGRTADYVEMPKALWPAQIHIHHLESFKKTIVVPRSWVVFEEGEKTFSRLPQVVIDSYYKEVTND